MRVQSSTRYVAMAALFGALACAGNKVRTEETAAARDTTTARDTMAQRDTLQNPPGYRGMERDTTIQPHEQTPTDTFLQKQGQGGAQDTAGYSGIERVDTTGAGAQRDTTGFGRDTTGVRDTSGMRSDTSGVDTTSMRHDTTGAAGLDTTGMSKTGDTTGYNPTQQSRDTTSR
jgi:hypothetical protein